MKIYSLPDVNIFFCNSIFLPPGQPFESRRLSLKPVPKLPNMESFLSEALVKVKKQARGFLAPELCFQAVKATTELPFADGVRKEQELFNVLLTSGQAKALQYAFFAERAVQKWTTPSGASWKSASPQPIHKAAVIGKGMKKPLWLLTAHLTAELKGSGMGVIGLYSWQKAEVGFPSCHSPKSPITGKDTPHP